MKVKFKHLMNGYTGVADDLVIYYMQRLGRCVMRRRPCRHENAGQEAFRAKTKNMFDLNPAQGYIDDLKEYVDSYQKRRHTCDATSTWSNIYTKLMFAMQKQLPGIDLATLTREQIFEQELPCRNVKLAVEAGLLPVVPEYERLVQMI